MKRLDIIVQQQVVIMSRIYALEHGLPPHFWNSQPEAMPPSVLSYNSTQTPLTYNGTPAMSSINNRTPLTSLYNITSPLPTCTLSSLYNVTSPMPTFTTTLIWDWCTWVHFKAGWKRLNLSALLYARNYDYKSGGVAAFKELENAGLGTLEETKTRAGTKVNNSKDYFVP